MKKLLLIILLLACYSKMTFSQYNVKFPSKESAYGWQYVGKNCTNCGAGYFGVTRSQYVNEFGNYQYSIFSYTSSYNQYNQLSYTYFSGIKVYAYDQGKWIALDNQLPFDIIVGTSQQLTYTLFSDNPNLYIWITINNIYPY